MLQKFSSRAALFVLFLVCLASFAFMFDASRSDSAIDDELAHIPAGYGYVHNFDYRLNPEHPPLIKALAMLPVLLLQPNFPTDSSAWQSDVNGQWSMGSQFLYNSGNDANAIVRTARIMPILITLFVIFLIYILASEIMGTWWALLPATIFALDPTVLAHGHYVTTDVGAAMGVLLATYFFLKFLFSPSRKHLIWAGLAFGVAQVTKFSMPLLVPLFIFLMIVWWLRDMAVDWHIVPQTQRFKIFLKRLGGFVWKLAVIFIVGYVLIVYPIYTLFTVNYPIAKQVSDTQTILHSFANGPAPAGEHCHLTRCLAEINIWMAGNPILRPMAQYMLGVLMVIQRSDGGNVIYFLGKVRPYGGWIYFPVLFALKEPVPTFLIVLSALLLALWWALKKAFATRGKIFRPIVDYLRNHFTEFSLASFIVLYWGYSMHSPLNIGIRHLMPTIPLIFILASIVWKKWITKINVGALTMIDPGANLGSFATMGKKLAQQFFFSSLKYVVLVLLMLWLLVETAVAAPYFLSYFNEFAGGTMDGYHYVTDSNYDWGQDMLRLQTWLNSHPEVDSIAVDYFGGANPNYYLGAKAVRWQASYGDPRAKDIHWIAISINQLENAVQPLAPGVTRDPSSTYSWLTDLRPPKEGMGKVPHPDYRAGTSIFIYHLP